MHLSDVRVGDTYRVEVPQQLQQQRHLLKVLGVRLWWQWQMLRGTKFRLTVTGIDEAAVPHPMVEGMRAVHGTQGTVRLTGGQVAELGLPPGAYQICGEVRPVDQSRMQLSDMETLCIPVTWLWPNDADQPPLGTPDH